MHLHSSPKSLYRSEKKVRSAVHVADAEGLWPPFHKYSLVSSWNSIGIRCWMVWPLDKPITACFICQSWVAQLCPHNPTRTRAAAGCWGFDARLNAVGSQERTTRWTHLQIVIMHGNLKQKKNQWVNDLILAWNHAAAVWEKHLKHAKLYVHTGAHQLTHHVARKNRLDRLVGQLGEAFTNMFPTVHSCIPSLSKAMSSRIDSSTKNAQTSCSLQTQ